MAPSASRDRPSLSCARCYLMKKKCDKKVPSCSRCVQAKARCLDINRSKKTEVPRSVVRYLESRLAELESNTLHRGNDHLSDGVSIPTYQGREPLDSGGERVYYSVLRIANLAMGSCCTSSILRNNPGIHYEAKLFYGSERPPLKIPVKGIYNEEPPRMASQGSAFRLPDMGARGIPFKVAKTLFDNYISNILPRYPCFANADLVDQFNQVYPNTSNPELVLPDTTFFIISMILAISSLTSKAHDFWKVASLSESLQRDAMQRSNFLGVSNITSLQCILLLIQMALLLPYTSNLWYLSGEAMRMAIAQGLHQEAEQHFKLDSAQINLRRSIFWTVYQLERTICIASGCPIAISDEHISTRMPSDTDTDTIEPSLGRSSRKNLSQFLSHVQLCQIQSEIHGVQFFDRPLPSDAPEYEDWICKMEQSIQAWQEHSLSSGDMPGWSLSAANHCRLLLYRPCSRNIVPSETALQIASTVAIRMIEGYWGLVQAGNLIFAFQYVYNAFQAGMVLLHAQRNHGPMEWESALEEEAHQALELLIQLFDALSARWPAAGDTGHYVKELKETILRSIEQEVTPGRAAYDINLLAELDFMVTQRRIHSVYHRNVEILTPENKIHSEPSPWSQVADQLTAFPDDLWQEIINNSFEFLADDSLPCLPPPNDEQAYEWTDFSKDVTNQGVGTNEDPKSTAYVEMLMDSLPACGYCRLQHTKCDRTFPLCGACKKTHRDCLFYDSMLQMDVSRSYVYSLYERVNALSNVGSTGALLSREPVIHPFGTQNINHNSFIPSVGIELTENGSVAAHVEQHQSYSTPSTWFFGRSSSLAYLEYALSLRSGRELSQDCYESLTRPTRFTIPSNYPDFPLPPISVSFALFRLFSVSFNVFYPTVKGHHLSSIITNLYNIYNQGSRTFDQYHNHDHDLFFLILAIGAQLAKNSDSGLAFAPHVYFHRATCHSERSRRNWKTIDQLFLLQRSLLICIYLLLSPACGDIWRNLGFAIRLYFDLSHRPSENDDLDEELMCMLSRALYCLECQVSIAFGRPSLLVIGDKLRDNITNPISGTAGERISAYFYRISLLKMQIHSRMIAKLDHQASDQTTLRDDIETHRHELKTWLTDWKEELTPNIEHDATTNNSEGLLVLVLEAWANLNYHHAALLLAHLPSSTIPDDPSPLYSCDQIIRSTSFLLRHQQKSLLIVSRPVAAVGELPPLHADGDIPLFPANWTSAHLIFWVGLSLLTWTERYTADMCLDERRGVTRRCLTVLALLEGDPTSLATGFSETLERLCFDNGWDNGRPDT